MNNKKKENNPNPKREADFELVAKIVLVFTIIGIIISSILMFTPPISGEEYSELGLLTYDESENKYKAEDYPSSVIYNQTTGYSENITLYILLGNHFNTAQFYEVRLKIGVQSVIIDENSFGTNETTYFLEEFWLQRILKIDQQWGPNNETKFNFQFNSTIISEIGLDSNGYKIIFELWKWNSQLNDFDYTGVFVYLTSFKLLLVS